MKNQNTKKNPNVLLSLKEAAELRGIPAEVLRRLPGGGVVPCFKVGALGA